MKTLAVTGHRPQDLFGFDQSHPQYAALREAIDGLLLQSYDEGYRRFLAGGAQGVDTIFAEAAFALREDRPDVEVVIAIPFFGQHKPWPEAAQARYKAMLEAADRLILTSDGEEVTPFVALGDNPVVLPYHQIVRALFARNEWMVDHSDGLLAVWNGKQDGGTYHCLNYALRWGKAVVRYDPRTTEITRLKSEPHEKEEDTK